MVVVHPKFLLGLFVVFLRGVNHATSLEFRGDFPHALQIGFLDGSDLFSGLDRLIRLRCLRRLDLFSQLGRRQTLHRPLAGSAYGYGRFRYRDECARGDAFLHAPAIPGLAVAWLAREIAFDDRAHFEHRLILVRGHESDHARRLGVLSHWESPFRFNKMEYTGVQRRSQHFFCGSVKIFVMLTRPPINSYDFAVVLFLVDLAFHQEGIQPVDPPLNSCLDLVFGHQRHSL